MVLGCGEGKLCIWYDYFANCLRSPRPVRSARDRAFKRLVKTARWRQTIGRTPRKTRQVHSNMGGLVGRVMSDFQPATLPDTMRRANIVTRVCSKVSVGSVNFVVIVSGRE